MTRYFRIYCFCTAVLLINSFSSAQDLGGLEVSSYAGIQGVNTQPAFLGDFAYKWDVNILGASASLLIKDLMPPSLVNNDFYKGDKGSLSSVITTKSQNFFVNARIYMPSVAYRINAKSAVSFNWSMRAVGFGRATGGSMAVFADSKNGLKEVASKPTLESAVGIVNTWQDFGLSYGRNIFNEQRHKLNVGATAKYLVGGGSGYIEFSNIDVTYDEQTNSVTDINGSIGIVFNDGLKEIANGESKKLFSTSGYGFNIGAIYEFKNETHLNRQLDRDGEPNYLFRVSTSIIDIGKISFNASNISAFYELNLNQPISPDYFDDVSSIGDLTTRLDNVFDLKSDELKKYDLNLPTSWRTNVDWNVIDHLYVNGLFEMTGVEMRYNYFKSRKLNLYQLSLRYEKAKYGFYTSFAYDEITKSGLSISARYSVLYLGVSNLFKFNSDNSLRTIGVMAMIRVPILNDSRKGARNIF